MKTEVVMKRELFGQEISQKSKSEFFSATDLVKAGNRFRIASGMSPFDLTEFLRNKTTKDFVNHLEKEYGKVVISARGRGHHTWVHPFLFIDIALAINPKLKLHVYKWLYDYLLKYRNESGDSYKKMSGALWLTCSNKSKFKNEIVYFANRIKKACSLTKSWEEATESQLQLRDRIQNNVALLSDILTDRENLINVSILKAKSK